MKRLLPLVAFCLVLLGACSPGVPAPDYPVEGSEPRRISPEPYARTPETAIALTDPDRPVDENGVALYEIPWEPGILLYHPVNLVMYGLYLVESYRATGEEEYLDRAIANADALLDGSVDVDGARWFPYGFDHRLNGDDDMALTAPWYSGMAQGQALSLFVRLHAETDDKRWMDVADETFESFLARPGGDGPWFSQVLHGNLWFEEYVAEGIVPTQVVNGHMYAMFGLYDYAVATGDGHAAQLFDGGAATMVTAFDLYRVPDGISYYCAAEYCEETDWRPDGYHRGVANQFDSLALMTGNGRFVEMARTFRSDYAASGATG